MTSPPLAGESMAELCLDEPGTGLVLCYRLRGPTPLVEAVAITLGQLIVSSHRLERRVRLYLVLLGQSDAAGRCRLYQEQLATLVGVSPRHLRRLLADLAAVGLVHIHPYPRPQPNGYFLPLLAALKESASPALADSTASAKEGTAAQRAESPMSHEHDDETLANKLNSHLLFLHEGQRQARLAQPHCTSGYLHAWDAWWAAGQFGRLRNPAGWANLQIRQGRRPPVAPTPLPLLVVESPAVTEPVEAPSAEEILWQRVLAQLQLQMTRATFDTWLGDTRLAAREGDCFIVAVKSGFACDWLDHRLHGIIKRAIAQATGLPPDQIQLRFRVGAG
ncbi:MAG: hypothetical protein KJ077_50255 [Anaerolineae bacterium]|nr:hypothetical protein [Anaerolineae bacterium]